MNEPDFANLDFSHLKMALGGGMAVQRVVAEKWEQLTGSRLLEGYGLTECSPLVTCCPLSQKSFNGSIGQPIWDTEVRVVDEKGQVLPQGESGELQVRGPQVMQGYWLRPLETEQAIDTEGWFSTGDIGYEDEQGYFYIVDRKKDMILVSGFNVFPNEIEEAVASHPKVLEAAAVGVPDEVSGEVVKVFVVAKEAALTKESIIEHCRGSLTGYKVPKLIEFRQDLPKSNVGKILRRELRGELVQ